MWLLHNPAAKAVLLMIAALLCLSPESDAQSQELTEYQVKAAFIYNFAKFVEWPGDAFTESAAPLRICVLGKTRSGRNSCA